MTVQIILNHMNYPAVMDARMSVTSTPGLKAVFLA
jgi:hypothetical protein